MIIFLMLVIISFVISILLSPLILRRIFHKAGFDVDFRNVLGLFRWLSEEITEVEQHSTRYIVELRFEAGYMTSILRKGDPEKREQFAEKVLHSEKIDV